MGDLQGWIGYTFSKTTRQFDELNNGEILIIAGKGHEEKQIIKNKIVNFDDVKIAKFYLNRRNKL